MTALATATQITDRSDLTAAGSIDRVIRVSTAVAVLSVAGVAAYVSYWHAYAVVRAHGESGVTARLEPATIDGLVYASSMVVLYAARHRLPVPPLARWLLGLGIAATLTANMAQGWSHGPVGAAVAAWPAVSLVGSYELLVWLIRTAGALERGPSAGDGQPSRSERGERDRTWRPVSQPAAHPAATASTHNADEVAGPDNVNGRAVAAYRRSMQAGNPLSERKLAQMFGQTSRRWARARIAEARREPPTPETETGRNCGRSGSDVQSLGWGWAGKPWVAAGELASEDDYEADEAVTH
jgi:hypothetical protein